MGKAKRRKQAKPGRTAPRPAPEAFRPAPAASPGVPVAFLCAGAFLAALAGYWFTFARTVTLVDSGELILACRELGVAHPPGTPLHTLLGHLFAILPFGSVAGRVAFFSSFCAAAAAALVTALAAETAASLSPRASEGEDGGTGDLERLTSRIAPAAIGITFAFSVTLWFYASVAEVYTLNIALVAGYLTLMLRWRRKSSSGLLLYGAALLFGLGIGVHHVTVGLTILGLAAFVLITAGPRFYGSRRFVTAFAAAVAGLSVYAYLPLAARGRPIFDWGDPSNLRRFWWHVSGKQYQVNLFSADREAVFRQLVVFLGWSWRQLTPVALLGALAGLWVLWRRQRAIFWLTALIIAGNVGFALFYDIAEDKDAYYLPTYLALAIALSAAVRHLSEWAARRGSRLPGVALLALLVALPVANFALHRFENNRSRFRLGRHYVEDALAPVPAGGLLLTGDWQFYSPFLYLRHVERFRPDAEVVDVNLVRRTWYVRTYLDRQYPDMMRACARQESEYLEDLDRWEQGRPFDPARLTLRFHALLNAFVDYHVPRDAALTMLPMTEEGVGTSYLWVPQGLAMRFYQDKGFHAEAPPALHLEDFDGTVFLDEVARGKVRRTYAEMTANRGRYLAAFGRLNEADKWIRSAIGLDPAFDRLYEFLGDLRAAQARPSEAADAYREALRLNPENAVARQRLFGSPSPARAN